ncbi:MAG: hypothetical protein ACI35K_01520, partial [Campylobacter sp.]
FLLALGARLEAGTRSLVFLGATATPWGYAPNPTQKPILEGILEFAQCFGLRGSGSKNKRCGTCV